MAAVKRPRTADLFSPGERAHFFDVSPWRGLALVGHAWAVIGAMVALCLVFPHPITFFVALPVIAGRQLGLAILMHEAAHGLLHPNKKINDHVGRWIAGAPVLTDLGAYRDYHLKHHRYTQQPEDPDLPLSAPFPVTKQSFRRKIVRDLTGQTFAKLLIGTLTIAFGPKTEEQSDQRAIARKALARKGIFLSLFFIISMAIGAPWLVFLWVVAFGTWFQLFLRLRNIAEHACTDTNDDPYTHARTTYGRWWERPFVAPYWVNYHAEHHLFMYAPCYRLRALHAALRDRGLTEGMTLADGYGSVLQLISSKPATAA